VLDLGLNGRVALVTGANQGIGAATARVLAAQGVVVLLTYLRLGAGGHASGGLPAEYDRVRAAVADLPGDVLGGGGAAEWLEADLSDPRLPSAAVRPTARTRLPIARRLGLGSRSHATHPRVACGLFDGLAHEPRRHGVQPGACRGPWTPRRVAGGSVLRRVRLAWRPACGFLAEAGHRAGSSSAASARGTALNSNAYKARPPLPTTRYTCCRHLELPRSDSRPCELDGWQRWRERSTPHYRLTRSRSSREIVHLRRSSPASAVTSTKLGSIFLYSLRSVTTTCSRMVLVPIV
jgi:hypothetical protein